MPTPPRLSSPRPAISAAALVILASLVGCTSPVAAGLDDGESNRVVAVLQSAGIDGRKEPESGSDGRFRVVVPESEAGRALGALADEGLPRPHSTGILDAVGKNQLVPTMAAEQAELAAGIGGELEKTFSQIDGVIVARVHLGLPTESPLREKKEKATASVVLSYKTAAMPIPEAQVKRIVASAVPNLAVDDVVVVGVPRVSKGGDHTAALAHVGPLGVAAGSATPLRLVLGALVLLVGLLAGATLVLYLRLARLRGARP